MPTEYDIFKYCVEAWYTDVDRTYSLKLNDFSFTKKCTINHCVI